MPRLLLLLLPLLALSPLAASQAGSPVRGTKCAANQVINRMTVYEDGALEAECGPLPCGASGARCIDNQVACRADTDVFSGMAWAQNGQSVLLRCCTVSLPKKIYVGTDLVTAGSYYVGGKIAEKDKYGSGGDEYDFVTNIRTEQGGVRVWVYRVMCDGTGGQKAPAIAAAAPPQREVPPTPIGGGAAQNDEQRQLAFEARRKYLLERLSGKQQEEEDEDDEEGEEQQPARYNPLRYRPGASSRQSTGVHRH